MSNLYLSSTSVTLSSAAEPTTLLLTGSMGATPSASRYKLTTNGPTAPLQITDSVSGAADGNLMAWYSLPVQSGVTVAGAITGMFWGQENSLNANTAPTMGIYRCDGNGAVLSMILNPATNLGAGEWANSGGSRTCSASAAAVVDTALSVGDRIKVALFIDDAADQGGTGNMVTAYNACFNYNGPMGSSGQSQISFTEAIPVPGVPAYEPTWLPAEALHGNAAHYGYEMKKLDSPEPSPKTTYPSATGGTTYPVAR